MPEITLPKNRMSNEFDVISGLYALAAYCVYPSDAYKRNEMTGVLNIEFFQKLKYDYFNLEKHKEELDTPEKAEEFWKGFKKFGKKHNFEISPDIANVITPRKFAENFKSAMIQLASNSLDLPEDMERFLLVSETPTRIKDEIKNNARAGMQTAILIMMKLMQLQKNTPNIRGGASLNKAINLLLCKEDASPIKNETDIRKAWDTYKKSVHLGMGLLMTYFVLSKTELIKEYNKGKGYMSDYISPICIALAFVFAKIFQDWLLSFKLSKHTPLSTATRLVKPTQLWTIPKRIKFKSDSLNAKTFVAAMPPFDEHELACLKSKRF